MSNIDEAINIFRQGGIVIFPTDTVWGIGCRLDNEKSSKKLFEIRNRAAEKAVIALVDSINMAQDYLLPVDVNVKNDILEKYWPQSLTVILPCREEKVPSIVRGGGNTLAVRIPSHPIILPLISKLGVPILAPSANFSGEKTPLRLEDIDKRLISLADFIVNGESLGKKPSTIIDCSVNPWKIIRQGDVTIDL